MSISKTRISVTIIHQLANMLEEIAKKEQTTKSALVERSIKKMVEERMSKEAKIIASTTFEDLPSEDEWLQIQSNF